MIRKQIYIKPDQETKLKEIASRFNISESELIREGINKALMGPHAIYKDDKAWIK